MEAELKEGQEDALGLYVNLDARPDSSSFEDWQYSSSQQICHPAIVFNDHELVTFVRYPQCPRDNLAIKVFKSTSMEVGYLHDQASALSPLIDAQMINLEGEVIHSRIEDVKHSVPCLLSRIFSKSTDLENVKRSIFGNNLSLTGEIRKDLETNEEGLWWLVNKENSDELPPFWVMKDRLYVNVLTRHRTNRKPQPLHGGIFADDYGMGETLTLLSLIAFDKAGNVPEEVSVSSGKKRRRVSEKDAGEPKKESSGGMADKSSSALVAKQTLIVSPSSVCSTWKNQLKEHTESGSLKLYKYYGENKIKDVEELKKYDIVLTTYGTFGIESYERRCPLLKIEWWRVILDEADVIKNANAKQSMAVSSLTTRRRWAVTGAPIHNGSFDLFALIAFLRLDPLSNKSYWQSLFERPLAKQDGNGFSRLQVLMASISLRRRKDRVLAGRLQSKTVETVRFKISGNEREQYDNMEAETKKVVRKLIEFDTGRLNRSYASIRGAVIRLRQMYASDHPELLRKLIGVLREDEDFDCAICYFPPTDAVITKCKHVFCKRCILRRTRNNCPICRGPLSISDLFSAPPQYFEEPGRFPAIIPSKKTLVQLQEPLKDAGFNVLRLDALSDSRRRDGIIKRFRSAGQDTVLLANVKVSGAGINLTAASEVYLLEPRLIVEDSIEERILAMQERKKQAIEASGRQGPEERREVSKEDLCSSLILE
ncbi:hypothetical protein DKX38_023612 [Salix brachista]|uniref:RING-type domain-containing protein n=1 Tax=Salix brachista TaxID=2182728 RepID=A0A5N5JPR1_9ROSI|nr:hypothetical protein DKX38_023612 [Salix brachista]